MMPVPNAGQLPTQMWGQPPAPMPGQMSAQMAAQMSPQIGGNMPAQATEAGKTKEGDVGALQFSGGSGSWKWTRNMQVRDRHPPAPLASDCFAIQTPNSSFRTMRTNMQRARGSTDSVSSR